MENETNSEVVQQRKEQRIKTLSYGALIVLACLTVYVVFLSLTK